MTKIVVSDNKIMTEMFVSTCMRQVWPLKKGKYIWDNVEQKIFFHGEYNCRLQKTDRIKLYTDATC